MSSYADNSLAVQSYSTALLNAAKSEGILDELVQDAGELQKLFDQKPEFLYFLESPQVYKSEKHAFAKTTLAGATPLLLNLIGIMIDRERIYLLRGTLREFLEKVEREQGIHRASVTSARQLDDAERDRLQKALEKFTGDKLRIRFRVDPDLLGGIVFRFKDTLVDGSIRHQLQNLRQVFENSEDRESKTPSSGR